MSRKSKEPVKYTYYGYDKLTGKSFRLTLCPGDENIWGGRFTEKEIIRMRDSDYRMKLEDRYWEEAKSTLFERQKEQAQNEDTDDYIDPVGNIRNRTDNNPASILTTETEYSDNDNEKMVKKLMELVRKLPEDEKTMFHELYENGMSMRAFGRMSGIGESTLRYRHKKLLAKLRKLL